ncbi:hypothetical protein GCM10017567_73990 [Amycolatopsis bullii]|uniref:Uncharacterized protein n=1 Tax=Amycolatopsis bullii TaxID=941987 RepID=A0ABQ3KXD1_9PSEU|nr:hypothetical protein GCM10017567_73990 [Amycolatopsis bullii]
MALQLGSRAGVDEVLTRTCTWWPVGLVHWPRVRKLRVVSPSIDVLTVQLPLGVSHRKFLASVDELAPALNAEQLQVAKVKTEPRQVRLVIFRNNPFEAPSRTPSACTRCWRSWMRP